MLCAYWLYVFVCLVMYGFIVVCLLWCCVVVVLLARLMRYFVGRADCNRCNSNLIWQNVSKCFNMSHLAKRFNRQTVTAATLTSSCLKMCTKIN